MFDDDDDDDMGFMLVVLGVLATVLVIVALVARSGEDLPAATVTGDTLEEAEADAEEPAATTTVAPTTTDAAAPATTEGTTTTAAPAAFTMWDALIDSGAASQFAAIGGALGLQADLEALEDADGNPVQRTLFAPSDEAVATLIAENPEIIGTLTSDPAAANALVGYHFLEGVYTADDLIALDGQMIPTRTGLPMAIDVVDGAVVLNGTITVTSTDFGGDNGVVHIVERLLTPPTVNEVIGLENIQFESGSDVITADSQEELQKAVAFFAENEGVNAVIEGYTDTDGDPDFNLDLSQRRADAVAAFLVENGIAADRLRSEGFGETLPILVEGVEDKAASRRIEFEAR
ncbi:MAG: OmpA family protein [Acidimicrobiales bacterium]